MSWHQNNSQSSNGQHLQAHSVPEDQEVAQLASFLEFLSFSADPPMPICLENITGAGLANIPESLQSFSISTVPAEANFSSNMATGQDEEASSGTSQLMPDLQNVSWDDIRKKVAVLVNFMLLKYQTKELIAKEEILNVVIQGYENHFTEIFTKASERMEIIFGLDVLSVDPTDQYFGVFIKLGLTYDGIPSGEVGVPKTGVLILVLGVIFMKANCATEEEVWEVLNVMGFYPGVEHFIFGEPRKLIMHDFVKEQYLTYQKVVDSDPVRFELLWGPRAHAETTKLKVLEFMAKVHGTDASAFPDQYQEALQEEAARKACASHGSRSMATA